jgi:hypothetical protein
MRKWKVIKVNEVINGEGKLVKALQVIVLSLSNLW